MRAAGGELAGLRNPGAHDLCVFDVLLQVMDYKLLPNEMREYPIMNSYVLPTYSGWSACMEYNDTNVAHFNLE